jgi:hypothetical protein
LEFLEIAKAGLIRKSFVFLMPIFAWYGGVAMKAKVFLSCGQSKVSEEPVVADKIADRIRDLGFECYMAVAEQSLLGLRENIFFHLQTADYLVFVDFKREELNVRRGNAQSTEPTFRGSLFSHQELAIASFLEIPALAFQEAGIKPLDGMLGAMQANAVNFSDRHLLPNVIADLINDKLLRGEWRTDTRNTLSLEVADPPFTDAVQPNRIMRRFYHVAVRNNHHRKAALHCYAYLDSITDMATNKVTTPKTVEVKWAGTPLPGVRIGPKALREFDAVNFFLTSPMQTMFFLITDSPDYLPGLQGMGKYRLTFSVVSQNFGTTTSDFVVEYGRTPDSVQFLKA